MGKEYRAKVFKSGNSLALRLPSELGLKEGSTMVLREGQTGYHFEPENTHGRKIDVSKFVGKAPGVKLAPRPDLDDSPRDWHLLNKLRAPE